MLFTCEYFFGVVCLFVRTYGRKHMAEEGRWAEKRKGMAESEGKPSGERLAFFVLRPFGRREKRLAYDLSLSRAASNSRCKEFMSSLTVVMLFTRKTLAPLKAKPRSRLPFMALSRAEAMQ